MGLLAETTTLTLDKMCRFLFNTLQEAIVGLTSLLLQGVISGSNEQRRSDLLRALSPNKDAWILTGAGKSARLLDIRTGIII